MYQVSVEKDFDAAHYLREYQGKCENLHGHRYKVVAAINTNKLSNGLAYDFVELKRKLNEVLSRFDHVCLNEIEPFTEINPSAENIATTVYQELKSKFGADPLIANIQVWESPTTCITYYP